MKVTTEQCSGKDAYGLILRGAAQGEDGHGYIVLFSCDGYFAVTRQDSTNPYTTELLLWWNESEFIRSGSNKNNNMGVLMEGNALSIYANGELLTPFPVYDDNYSFGRWGLFVNAWDTQNFTYKISEVNIWKLP
jgi:hypothetical protein